MSELDQVWQQAESYTQSAADAINELVAAKPIVEPSSRWLWLTMANCGLAVEVLRQQFEQVGIESVALINQAAEGKAFSQHVILAVDGDEGTTYVDPTYLQMFSEYGLDASLAVTGLQNNLGQILPQDKSLVYTDQTAEEVVGWMSGQTQHLLRKWQHSGAWQYSDSNNRPFGMPSTQQLQDFFWSVYDPSCYESFEQGSDQQQVVHEFLDTYEPNKISVAALLRHYLKELD